MEVEETIEPVAIKIVSPEKKKNFSLPDDDIEDNYEDDEDENAPEETDRETLEPPISSGTQDRPLF